MSLTKPQGFVCARISAFQRLQKRKREISQNECQEGLLGEFHWQTDVVILGEIIRSVQFSIFKRPVQFLRVLKLRSYRTLFLKYLVLEFCLLPFSRSWEWSVHNGIDSSPGFVLVTLPMKTWYFFKCRFTHDHRFEGAGRGSENHGVWVPAKAGSLQPTAQVGGQMGLEYTRSRRLRNLSTSVSVPRHSHVKEVLPWRWEGKERVVATPKFKDKHCSLHLRVRVRRVCDGAPAKVCIQTEPEGRSPYALVWSCDLDLTRMTLINCSPYRGVSLAY